MDIEKTELQGKKISTLINEIDYLDAMIEATSFSKMFTTIEKTELTSIYKKFKKKRVNTRNNLTRGFSAYEKANTPTDKSIG